MVEQQEGTEGQEQQPEADAKKRTRKAPEKPFMIQVQINLKDKLPEGKIDVAWVDVPVDKKIESAADAWKLVESLEREGTYRVVQHCGEHVLEVKKQTVTTLK